jgi:hypothetical protein
MSELADVLHRMIDAIDRPADHPSADLHAAVDGLGAAPAADQPSEADTPAVHPAADDVTDDQPGPEP